MRTAKPAFVGARVVDSLPFSQGGTLDQAKRLKDTGIDGVALYLGVASAALVDTCLSVGLGVWGVTLANKFDGIAATSEAIHMGLSTGTTLFLDIEGPETMRMTDDELVASATGWAKAVGTQFMPGAYVAPPQPLSAKKLYALPFVRYWRAPGWIRDRNNLPADPMCGWCVTQLWPSLWWPNETDRDRVWVDVNMVGQDIPLVGAVGRVPSWTVEE